MTVHERMAKVTAALSHIPKQRSQGVNYEFRGIDAVMNVLHGPLADNGLFLSPRVLDDWQVNMIPGTNNRQQAQALFRVCVDVYAEDGTSVTLGPGLAQSHDYGDKAVYQAQQNAIKYLLLEAFCIPTSEQDMDARQSDEIPQTVAPDSHPTLEQLMDQLGDLVAKAREKGVEGDYDTMIDWAAQSAGNARAAIAKIEGALS